MVLDPWLVPLHTHDGCKWINCRGKPLKHLTLMKRRRVIQMVFTSWWIPFLFILTFSLLSVRLNSFEHAMTIVGYLYLFFEKILCLMLIFFTSMFLVVYNLNSRDRTVARQLNFNHWIVKVQTQNKSAVKWLVLVTCIFLLRYGIFLRCSWLFHRPECYCLSRHVLAVPI